jgi:hypothetical protein
MMSRYVLFSCTSRAHKLQKAALLIFRQSESDLVDIKAKVKKLTRVFNKNSATEASIESDQFTIQ